MDSAALFLAILTVCSSELSFRTTSAATINLTQIEPAILRPIFEPDDEFSHTSFIDLIRDKRQSRRCKASEWKCRNGKCIPSEGTCDGVVDCADGSDEILATCQNFRCGPQYFRCAYGACVDSESKCNGTKECADNSDELHKDCFPNNQTIENDCTENEFVCKDGSCRGLDVACDGTVDCPDGSDETLTQCSGNRCPKPHFKCAYGACIDSDGRCNQVKDCADNSDESVELCNPTAPIATTKPPTVVTQNPPTSVTGCVLPNYPRNGKHEYPVDPQAKPGNSVPEFSLLMYSCDKDYSIVGSASVNCIKGAWSAKTKCAKTCEPLKSITVKFSCVKSGVDVDCDQRMEMGTVATASCVASHITTTAPSKLKLTCSRGLWNNPTPRCSPECGEEKGKAATFILGGRKVVRGESPWHVGIYSTLNVDANFEQMCGGTILTVNIVISAAHCYWNNPSGVLYPATFYSVAVGKLFRDYDNVEDKKYNYVQFSDVLEIKVPPTYGGSEQQQQSDIALLIIQKPFVFSESVHPICIDLSESQFDKAQTARNSLGKGAGWGVTAEGGEASPDLKVVELPVVDYADCRNRMPTTFRRYLTSDKFCAGYLNGTAMCSGDSGGGLVFKSTERSVDRWYLRGVVSVGVPSETSDTCRNNTYTGFTQIFMHRDWINDIFDLYK